MDYEEILDMIDNIGEIKAKTEQECAETEVNSLNILMSFQRYVRKLKNEQD